MSRPGSLAVLLLAATSWPVSAAAEFQVSGEVLATDPRLEVRVQLTNLGSARTESIEVTGDWRGQRAAGRLGAGLEPRASGSVVLGFEVGLAPPGVHVLPLLFEHPLPGARDAGGNPPMASQRGWLLVALEESPAPEVGLRAEATRLEVSGRLGVELTSLDRRPHRVELRALPARGLRVETQPAQVDVPAEGKARVEVELMRSGATRGSSHGVLLAAETRGRLPQSAAVAVATVTVEPFSGPLRRLRGWLVGLAVALLLAGVGMEAWKALRPRPPDPPLAA